MEVGGIAMDVQAAMGLPAVIRQSFSVLSKRSKLFFFLSVTLTLPLCFIVLAHNLAVDPLVSRINRYEDAYPVTDNSLSHRITLDRIRLGVLLSVYVLLVLILTLLSTAATVYSVACIYTKRPLDYRRVLSVLPRVWRRLLVTFLWAFVFVFFLVGAFLAAILFVYLVFLPRTSALAVILWWLFSLIFLAALFHYTCVFSLASIVSVLEPSFGLRSIKKSSFLIQGRRLLVYSLYALYLIFASAVVIAFDFSVRPLHHVAVKAVIGIAFACMLTFVNLMGMIVFTIVYFTCKAFHHESIDILALSEHLGAYSGEYVNLRSAVQMENMQHSQV